MLSFAFELPRGSIYGRGPLVVVMILEAENLARMAEADPFDMKLADLPQTPRYKASEIDLIIAHEQDFAPLAKFQKDKDIAGLMQWLERGRNIIPGDCIPPIKVDLSKGFKQ